MGRHAWVRPIHLLRKVSAARFDGNQSASTAPSCGNSKVANRFPLRNAVPCHVNKTRQSKLRIIGSFPRGVMDRRLVPNQPVVREYGWAVFCTLSGVSIHPEE